MVAVDLNAFMNECPHVCNTTIVCAYMQTYIIYSVKLGKPYTKSQECMNLKVSIQKIQKLAPYQKPTIWYKCVCTHSHVRRCVLVCRLVGVELLP